jgi:hypothetical protein
MHVVCTVHQYIHSLSWFSVPHGRKKKIEKESNLYVHILDAIDEISIGITNTEVVALLEELLTNQYANNTTS